VGGETGEENEEMESKKEGDDDDDDDDDKMPKEVFVAKDDGSACFNYCCPPIFEEDVS